MPSSWGSATQTGNQVNNVALAAAAMPSTVIAPVATPVKSQTHSHISSVPLSDVPDILQWFRYLDKHEEHNKDGITFSEYGPILRGKGFVWIFQLTVDDFTYQDLQRELECDGIGTAILIKEYAKQDMQALRSGTWVFPKEFTYDYDY